uniref:Uncharacterized protein n=1 Tax=Piliocolobus tephrosceles TaxID=591936 RepID=A0A8C9J1G0_9PRIM
MYKRNKCTVHITIKVLIKYCSLVLPTPTYPHLSLTLLFSPEWLGKMRRGLAWHGHLLNAWIDHIANEFSRGAIF